MPTILDQLADEARERVAAAKAVRSLAEVREAAACVQGFGVGGQVASAPTRAAAARRPNAAAGSQGLVTSFETALAGPGVSFICEVKKASPSKGLIAAEFPYLEIARDYEAAGAAAISVLTEPRHFLGSAEYLREIARAVRIPVLRKDFTVDEYQIYEARELGAAAVLLICAILSPAQLSEYVQLADELGLGCLVEAHTASETATAVDAGARIIGVNNRNLHDFSVDASIARDLRALVPPGRLFVAESGIATPEDAAAAAAAGADAVLVGEALMRASDRRGLLREMRAKSDEVVGVTAPLSIPAEVAPATLVADVSPKVISTSATSGALPSTDAVRIKICGITRPEDVPVLNETLPEYAGFVFVPGRRRRVSLETALRLRALLDPQVVTVGVFIDQPVAEIEAAYTAGAITVAQLHGDEDAAFVAALRAAAPGIVVIKAVRVRDAASIAAGVSIGADYLLLDGELAGSGQEFDWTLIDSPKLPPFFLAGGLRPDNVGRARAVRPWGVDVSSGVETDGVKDARKIRAFVTNARSEK